MQVAARPGTTISARTLSGLHRSRMSAALDVDAAFAVTQSPLPSIGCSAERTNAYPSRADAHVDPARRPPRPDKRAQAFVGDEYRADDDGRRGIWQSTRDLLWSLEVASDQAHV